VRARAAIVTDGQSEKGRMLLGTVDIGITDAPGRHLPDEGGFEGPGRRKKAEREDLLGRDAVGTGNPRPAQSTAGPNPLEGVQIGKNHV